VPEWLDTPGEILATLSIAGIALGLLIWIVKAQVAQLTQLTTRNGGSTIRSQLDRIESDLREHRRDVIERDNRVMDSVAKVHARLDEHIQHHLKG